MCDIVGILHFDRISEASAQVERGADLGERRICYANFAGVT
jgi:hypothetical protein